MQNKYLTILFLLFCSFLTRAQNYVYTYELLNTRSGLSNGNVNHFFQDSRGLMWLATNDGLSMYDGTTFVNYLSKPGQNSIAHNTLRYITEDKNGDLWIGTKHGLSFLDFKQKKFKNFTKQSHQLSENDIRVMFIDTKGKIWLGSKRKVDVFDPKTEKIIKRFTLSRSIDVFFEDKEGDFYVSNAKSISKFDDSKNVFEEVFTLSQDYKKQYLGKCIDNQGYIWSAVEGQDDLTYLLKLHPKTYHYDVFADSSANYIKNIKNRSVQFSKDKQGNIWKREGAYLSSINPQRPQEQSVYFLEEVVEKYEKSSRVFLDNNDVFWLDLMGGGGVMLLPKWRIEKIKYYHYDKDNPNGLTAKATRGIIKHKDKTWIGLYSHLDVFSESGEKLHTIRNFPAYCFALDYQEPNKFLWIGSEGKGLYKVNQSDYSYQEFLNKEYISIYAIARNKAMVCLATSQGLILFDTRTEQHELFRYHEEGVEDKIKYVLNSHKGFLWVGTTEDGLLRFNLKTKKFTKVNVKADLTSFEIKSIYQDNEGVIWIATEGNGFVKFNPKSKETKIWREEDGLINNVVYGILEDKEGFLWMSTNKGISQFDPKTEKFRNLNEYDGLQNNEFNTASFYKSDDGELFFGGVNGINTFYSDDLFNPLPPKIWLKKITTRNQENYLNTSEQGFSLELSYEEAKLFTLEFAALSYYQSHRNEYKYIIEGVYQNWKYLGSNAQINEHLSPGTYTLKVQASNSHGLWNQKGMTIKIIVYAPFWQQSWFQLLILVTCLAIIYFVYRLRVRSLKRYQKELEYIVALRTKEIQEASEEVILQRDQITEKTEIVEAQKQELEFKNRTLLELNEEKNLLIGVVAHDLKSPLNQVKGLTYLISTSEEKLPEEINQYISMISDAVERLREMITRVLDINAIENKQLNLDITPVELVDLLSKVGESFEIQAEKKKVTLHYPSSSSQFILDTDSNYLRQILENLISNAIKFSPSQKNVFLSVESHDNKIIIKVRDEGPGISPSDQQKLFMKYHKLSAKPTAGEESTGLGLAIAKKFVEAIEGKLYCESELGQGATFIIEFREKVQKASH